MSCLRRAVPALVLLFACIASAEPQIYKPTPEQLRAAYQRAAEMPTIGRNRVFGTSINPTWFDDSTKFWYRVDLVDGQRRFMLVDAVKGERREAFDHARLAEALGKATGKTVGPTRLPFDRITFTNDGKAVAFEVNGQKWQCDLASYACTRYEGSLAPDASSRPAGRRRGRVFDRSTVRPRDNEARSPDRKWIAFIKDRNVYIRPDGGGDAVQLTSDGKESNAWNAMVWAPDSKTLIAHRIEPGDHKEVYLIESSPKGGGPAKLISHLYPRPGDKFPAYEMWLFDVASHKATKVQTDRIDFNGPPELHFRDGGKRFTFERTDRGHQRFRIIEVDCASGKTRNIVDEKTKTFINGLKHFTYYLNDGKEIIWASEKDGWNHLYLVDGDTGRIKYLITPGEYPVFGVDRVDEANRVVWFHAGGVYPGQDPYYVHYLRVNFDGTHLVRMTRADGTHAIFYSPDGKYFVDQYSRVDLPTVHELHRTEDGSLVCPLEKADVSALLATGWKFPERFVAKGRDGKTDIYGIILRPRNFDPKMKYPVIENIYAGPQGAFVPKRFSAHFHSMHELAELGFIVVQIDGMGTSNRSKAFHDVCWKNLADAGLPDRILWIKALAAKDPSVDATRVGIYGTSAGGQSSTGAMLFHPEFYKAAVSSCGCHDNWMDKAWWNEQWMGYPVGPQYKADSNITNAAKLKGHLLLMVGELDHNVPPESTYRLCDALIKANKNFDFLVLTGSDHTDGGAYGQHKREDFFVKHLLGVDPPDWN